MELECELSSSFGESTIAPLGFSNWPLYEGRFIGQTLLRLGGADSPEVIPTGVDAPSNLPGRLVPPEESRALFEKAGEPKKLVVLEGYGHYEVYLPPALDEVMAETTEWFPEHLPADSRGPVRSTASDATSGLHATH